MVSEYVGVIHPHLDPDCVHTFKCLSKFDVHSVCAVSILFGRNIHFTVIFLSFLVHTVKNFPSTIAGKDDFSELSSRLSSASILSDAMFMFTRIVHR